MAGMGFVLIDGYRLGETPALSQEHAVPGSGGGASAGSDAQEGAPHPAPQE